MEWLSEAPRAAACLALLPGAWNPPTYAHLALAEAALERADHLVFVLPRAFPHKRVEGAGRALRRDWLRALTALDRRFSAAESEGGLFVEIAREARAASGAGRIALVCGSDAAARIVAWDYGATEPIERQLAEFELWVATRNAAYAAPSHLAPHIRALDVGEGYHEISSSDVRERVQTGRGWEPLVPAPIRDSVGAAYS